MENGKKLTGNNITAKRRLIRGCAFSSVKCH